MAEYTLKLNDHDLRVVEFALNMGVAALQGLTAKMQAQIAEQNAKPPAPEENK